MCTEIYDVSIFKNFSFPYSAFSSSKKLIKRKPRTELVKKSMKHITMKKKFFQADLSRNEPLNQTLFLARATFANLVLIACSAGKVFSSILRLNKILFHSTFRVRGIKVCLSVGFVEPQKALRLFKQTL